MATTLNTDAGQIEAYPYALSITTACKQTTVLHYDDKAAADLFAALMTGDETAVVRYVANVETHEWHEVTEVLPMNYPPPPVRIPPAPHTSGTGSH